MLLTDRGGAFRTRDPDLTGTSVEHHFEVLDFLAYNVTLWSSFNPTPIPTSPKYVDSFFEAKLLISFITLAGAGLWSFQTIIQGSGFSGIQSGSALVSLAACRAGPVFRFLTVCLVAFNAISDSPRTDNTNRHANMSYIQYANKC